ncbi:S1 RNA-binding domain-containing protein [Clostridium tetani]|nr:S1 RNA-binding domain-containing protein [Clostridium tetani]
MFYIYIDKSERIAATTDIESYLEMAEGYKIGDEVEGIIYDIYDNNSVAVAVEGKYRAVMLKNEYYVKVNPGDKLKFKVKRIYEDGNLGLTIRITGKEQRDKLQEDILEYLKENNGFMPLNDYSSPEDIKNVFKESKNYFKRSLGGLMKKGLIEQTKEGTKLIQK